MDSTGRVVLPATYPELGEVRDGLTIASGADRKTAGRKGVIDVKGQVRIPFAYDRIEFVDDVAVLVGRGTGERITDMKMAYMRLADGQYIWKEEGFDSK